MYRFWSAKRFYNYIKGWYKAIPENGWPCHVLSNHDQPRGRSRFMGGADSEKRARIAAVFLLTVKGTPFLYYGEELGMKNTQISRREIVDPLGKRYWPIYRGRDSARTPMLWNSRENAGFSKNRPWLPVDSDYKRLNVRYQMNDKYSILNFYKELISLRKKFKALHEGEFIPKINGFNNITAYFRAHENETFFVVLNFSSEEKKINAGERAQWKVMLSTHRTNREYFTSLSMNLSPYEATIVMKISEL
jgi:alpha-glucosidase